MYYAIIYILYRYGYYYIKHSFMSEVLASKINCTAFQLNLKSFSLPMQLDSYMHQKYVSSATIVAVYVWLEYAKRLSQLNSFTANMNCVQFPKIGRKPWPPPCSLKKCLFTVNVLVRT